MAWLSVGGSAAPELLSDTDSVRGKLIMLSVHVSQDAVSEMTPDTVEELARRLEADAYDNAFEGLQDWHLLRALAFQRPELVESYVYLLDLEPYDES